MPKERHHPKAYLQEIRNLRSGLRARTKILDVLDRHSSTARTTAQEISLSYNVVLHHLRLLEAEGTVTRKGKKPHYWLLTGIGQERLVI